MLIVAISAPTTPTKTPINPVKTPEQTPNRWRDWVVRLYNDSFNSFEFVVQCLVRHVPGMSEDMAWAVAWQAHREGVAATYQGPQEMAEMVCSALCREGLISDCAES
jgi:ATP-dependent Clp protease adaptor protein ClpS